MMTVIVENQAPAAETTFSRCCHNIEIVLDCTIPFVLAAAIVIGSGAVILGYVD
jgi:hypothetical protein